MSGPRIVHFLPAFSLLTETFLYEQFTAQREVGVDARVVSHRRVDEQRRPFPAVRIVPRVERFSGEWWVAQARRAIAFDVTRNSCTARLAGAFREEGAGLVHAHYGWSGQIVLAAAREAGLPLVVTFHGADSNATQPWLARRVLEHLFEEAARVLAISERMADRVEALGCPREKIRVHRIGIRMADFAHRETVPALGDELLVVSVGRLVEKKGMDILLEAAARIARGGRRLQLVVIGAGPEEERLARIGEGLPKGVRVEFTGALPREEVLRRMREAHLFVLASRTARNGDVEGIPTVLVEAQAMGIPVVSTLHEGIPEAFPAENRRWLAPEGDPEALADRIESLASHAGQWGEIARRGRAHVISEFDSLTQARRAKAIYEEVLGGPTGR